VLTKTMWERTQKNSLFKTVSNSFFEEKREKVV